MATHGRNVYKDYSLKARFAHISPDIDMRRKDRYQWCRVLFENNDYIALEKKHEGSRVCLFGEDVLINYSEVDIIDKVTDEQVSSFNMYFKNILIGDIANTVVEPLNSCYEEIWEEMKKYEIKYRPSNVLYTTNNYHRPYGIKTDDKVVRTLLVGTHNMNEEFMYMVSDIIEYIIKSRYKTSVITIMNKTENNMLIRYDLNNLSDDNCDITVNRLQMFVNVFNK